MIARLVAWLTAHVRIGDGKSGSTNGGYWGGVTFWDRLKAGVKAAAAKSTAFLRRQMGRKTCRAELRMGDDTYVCDRPHGHDGKHRERRMYGGDETGQYVASVRWRRIRDRRA